MAEFDNSKKNVDLQRLSRNEDELSYWVIDIMLSNDPDEVDSSFFYYAATVLSHIGMLSFLHRECINLHEGRLRNNMH